MILQKPKEALTFSPEGAQKKSDYGTVKRIMQAFYPYRGAVALVFLSVVIATILGMIVPLLLPAVFDDALVGHNMDHLLTYASIMISATFAVGLIQVAQTYLNNRVGQNVMRDFRLKLYDHLQDMSLHFFTSVRTGEIQSRLSNDVNAAQAAVTDTFMQVLTTIFTAIGTLVVMLYISPALTIISFVLLPLFLWFTFRVGGVRRNLSRASQQSMASLSALMQETLSVSGILLIKIFGRKRFALSQFEEENQKLTDLNMRRQMVGRWFFMFMNVFGTATPVLLYIVAGWIVIYKPSFAHVTLGGLVAFLTLQGKFFGTFSDLLSLHVNIQGSMAMFDRIFEYLDLPIEIQDSPDAITLSKEDVRGEVTFQHVNFQYKQSEFAFLKDPYEQRKQKNSSKKLGKKGAPPEQSVKPLKAPLDAVIENLSFTIAPGKLVALVGPSGAGKTTITYLLPRLYDVDSGAIEIDGYNIKSIALASLGDLIGTVTQETYLFHATVRENLLYVRPEATEEEIIAATEAAAIHQRIMELEDGYDTVVGERGYRLSGGEKQRLAIARVLLKNPRILILDEATSALDTHSERLIQAALEPLMKGRTTIAIAHRLSTILAADLILVLDKGKVVEQGTHAELLAYGGLYAHLYQQQFIQQMLETTSM